eukprot:UN16910
MFVPRILPSRFYINSDPSTFGSRHFMFFMSTTKLSIMVAHAVLWCITRVLR